MTSIHQWRRNLAACLTSVAGDLAAFEADRLMGQVLGQGPTELTLHAESELTDTQERHLEAILNRRMTGVPLAYVLGHVEFYGLDLICDQRALIPRPETEELVQLALGCLPPAGDGRPLVLDMGTGAGNIALAMAHTRPDLRVIATDTECDALDLAHLNRDRLHLTDRVQFIAGQTLTMFGESRFITMIVTNPPYIALGDPNLEQSVIDHEPHSALFSGPSGLEIISELLEEAASRLVTGGWLITEIGYDQGDTLRSITQSLKDWEKPTFHRDLAGIERMMTIRRR